MRQLGDAYEERAVKWLLEHGLHIVTRNFSAKTGEIDIIALDGQTLAFIEVRARAHPRFASAASSVDRRKQQRLLRTAQLFLQRHRQLANSPCRFDVIAFASDEQPQWIKSAFTA